MLLESTLGYGALGVEALRRCDEEGFAGCLHVGTRAAAPHTPLNDASRSSGRLLASVLPAASLAEVEQAAAGHLGKSQIA